MINKNRKLSDGGFYNNRKPLLDNTPITYSVERYTPPSTTPVKN